MSKFKEFKEIQEEINTVKEEMNDTINELVDNVYSSINQINFSIKLIVDIEHFINSYTGDITGLDSKLRTALTTPDFETNIDLNRNIMFSSIFIRSILEFEEFSKIMTTSILNHLSSKHKPSGELT